MKTQIFNGWNFPRWMRLGLGISITVQSIYVHEPAMIAIGVLLAGMAVLNTGCFSAGGCTMPARKSSVTKKEIDYEEIV